MSPFLQPQRSEICTGCDSTGTNRAVSSVACPKAALILSRRFFSVVRWRSRLGRLSGCGTHIPTRYLSAGRSSSTLSIVSQTVLRGLQGVPYPLLVSGSRGTKLAMSVSSRLTGSDGSDATGGGADGNGSAFCAPMPGSIGDRGGTAGGSTVCAVAISTDGFGNGQDGGADKSLSNDAKSMKSAKLRSVSVPPASPGRVVALLAACVALGI